MRDAAEFAQVFEHGYRLNERYFTAIVRRRPAGHASPGPRLGLAVSRRALPLSVQRARWKRQARESFRLNARWLPTLDIVILAKPTPTTELSRLRDNLDRVWQRIASTCRES